MPQDLAAPQTSVSIIDDTRFSLHFLALHLPPSLGVPAELYDYPMISDRYLL